MSITLQNIMLSINKTKGVAMDKSKDNAKTKMFQDALVDEKDFLKIFYSNFIAKSLTNKLKIK